MQLTNAFTVNAAPDVMWEVLNDVERFAPYIPGFVLTEADGDLYRGHMKVKVGAVTAQYDVEIRVTERDAKTRTVRAVASGKERKGAGSVRAEVTGTLAPHGAATEATILTELEVTGRVAQFGRNILAEVAGKLLTRFARDLETKVLAGGDDGSGAAPGPLAPVPVAPAVATSEPVDLIDLAGASVVKRVVPAGLAAVLLSLFLYLVLRRQ